MALRQEQRARRTSHVTTHAHTLHSFLNTLSLSWLMKSNFRPSLRELWWNRSFRKKTHCWTFPSSGGFSQFFHQRSNIHIFIIHISHIHYPESICVCVCVCTFIPLFILRGYSCSFRFPKHPKTNLFIYPSMWITNSCMQYSMTCVCVCVRMCTRVCVCACVCVWASPDPFISCVCVKVPADCSLGLKSETTKRPTTSGKDSHTNLMSL